jgi:HSP20 family protein
MWDSFEDLMPTIAPAMDMYETKSDVIVEAPLAGVKPEEVEVTVEKGVLTLKGESKKEHEVDDKNYYRKEVRSGSFFRQVALPVAVKEDKVSAEFVDGVLKITCPKAEQTPVKKISVKIVKKDKK